MPRGPRAPRGLAPAPAPAPVERTVPFGFYTQTIVICWYTLHGHTSYTVTQRRTAAPWYPTKPSRPTKT
ncbi:hypothetical protein GCM10010109_55810 [Actinoplanes campanulatus]|nr:hypothetical protein GCM10010109_55810 [Actinoplanes campanulatus]GID38356.1 hypothetical protein Aca09nite_48620 [Actinoplanes campanulatus]